MSSQVSIPKYTKCYTCYRIVKEDHFSEHLLFGGVRCDVCNVIFRDCQSFQIYTTEYSLGNVMCNHDFHYTKHPIAYLTKHLFDKRHLVIEEKDVNIIRTYIDKLKSLEDSPPWNGAIEDCRTILSRYEKTGKGSANLELNFKINSQVYYDKKKVPEAVNSMPVLTNSPTYVNNEKSDNCSNDLINMNKNSDDTDGIELDGTFLQDHMKEFEDSIEIVKVRECNYSVTSSENIGTKDTVEKSETVNNIKTSINDSDHSVEYVDLPPDDFYYVSTEPIEECPYCYEVLCPSQFTLNTETFLMTIVCVGCSLTIYITTVAEDVQIVTEDVNRARKGNKTVRKATLTALKPKKKAGRPRKKAYLKGYF